MARRWLPILILLALLMDARSLWSGGVQWGAAATARANGYWLPDGATPTGRPFPDVAIGGELLTASLMSASWSLGISDLLADLAPSTASLSFKGQVTAAPGDDVVISIGWGVMWVGRLDTTTDTRDVSGEHWTTVTATDRVGALGAAVLRRSDGVEGTFDAIAVSVAASAGIPLAVEDLSVGTYGLVTLEDFAYWSKTYTGTVLGYLSIAARSSNAMLATGRDGVLRVMTREALPSGPTSSLTLTGANAPTSWTESTSADSIINRWEFTDPGGVDLAEADAAAIATYGERTYVVDDWLDAGTSPPWLILAQAFTDWFAYTPAPRPVVTSAELVASSFATQEALLTLDPLDWVTESGKDWQVLSMRWDAIAGQPMRLTITADNLLDLL